jgi:hypothetical protein
MQPSQQPPRSQFIGAATLGVAALVAAISVASELRPSELQAAQRTFQPQAELFAQTMVATVEQCMDALEIGASAFEVRAFIARRSRLAPANGASLQGMNQVFAQPLDHAVLALMHRFRGIFPFSSIATVLPMTYGEFQDWLPDLRRAYNTSTISYGSYTGAVPSSRDQVSPFSCLPSC